MSHIVFFVFLLLLLIIERLIELRAANKNFKRLLERGGREFGAEHYPLIVTMHTAFFLCLVVEFILRDAPLSNYFMLPLLLLAIAQAMRFWTLRAMKDRWTTRVVVVPGEHLVNEGPFRFASHPNYTAVALELFSLPLIFGLYWTCVVFTILNAVILLFIRIPCERKALEWSQMTENNRVLIET